MCYGTILILTQVSQLKAGIYLRNNTYTNHTYTYGTILILTQVSQLKAGSELLLPLPGEEEEEEAPEAGRSVVVFEEVDVLLDEDKGFVGAMSHLLQSTQVSISLSLYRYLCVYIHVSMSIYLCLYDHCTSMSTYLYVMR